MTRTSCLYLSLLVVVVVISGQVNARGIHFDATAPCAVLQYSCNFFDNDTWIEKLYPGPMDDVYIDGSNSSKQVTIVLDSNSPEGYPANVSFRDVNSVNLHFENVSAYIDTFRSLSTANVLIMNSQVNISSLSANSLAVNGSSLAIGDTPYYVSFVIFDSIISSSSILSVHNLTAYGNTVMNCNMSVGRNATFISVPNLKFDFVEVLYTSNLTFIDSPSNISFLSLNPYASVNYFASSSATAAHTLLEIYGYASLQLGNNITLLLGQAVEIILSMGNYSSLTTLPGALQPVGIKSQNISSLATITAGSDLSFYGGFVPASVFVAEGASLTIEYATTFGVADNACKVTCPGNLVVYSPFTCAGSLKIGSVYISSTLNVSSLSTELLSGHSNGYINGNVETERLSLNYPLTIYGNFMQSTGNISIYLGSSYKNSPILSVEGKLKLSAEFVTVNSGSYLDETDAEFMFAKFEKSDKIHLQHLADQNRTLSYRVAEKTLLIGRHRSCISSNYQWMIITGVLGMILIPIVCCMSCAKKSQTFEDLEKNYPHATIKNYISNFQWKSVTGSAILVIAGIFFLPLLLEACFFSIALAVLIPLALLLAIFEHRFVFWWAVIVLFMQVGGFLDLLADVSLVANSFISLFFYCSLKIDIEILKDQEALSLVRIGITLGGAIMSLLFIWLITTVFNKSLYQLTGKMIHCNGSVNIRRIVFGILGLVCIVLWKVILMSLRAHLFFAVAKSLVTKGWITEEVQRKIQWIEIILLLDLMWSGFPLGVLSALELSVYDTGLDGGAVVIESIKMGALAVDLVGACFLIYFVIFGLHHKFPGLHHAHHDSHSATVNATATTPLLIGALDQYLVKK